MQKLVKAVPSYIHPGFLNFKMDPYYAWVKAGGRTTPSHYPWRKLHGLAFRYELPALFKSKKEARLRFVEPVSISFDTFPDYARYEIIPVIWDCWPCHFEKTCKWFQKHNVRTAIFTSSQTADLMCQRFPDMNILYCPEGIDSSIYISGKPLKDRSIDLLEFGRSNEKILKDAFPDTINHVCTKKNGKFIYDNDQLISAMGDAKVTIALPRSITQPEIAGDIETLTQRYWECMLSRIVMVGKAPQELIDLIGYNPVIDMDFSDPTSQILEILDHIEDYQELVDKNRQTALEKGDWSIRIRQIMDWLTTLGYQV